MLHKNFSYFDKLIKFEKVHLLPHCDIPCKINDPFNFYYSCVIGYSAY